MIHTNREIPYTLHNMRMLKNYRREKKLQVNRASIVSQIITDVAKALFYFVYSRAVMCMPYYVYYLNVYYTGVVPM